MKIYQFITKDPGILTRDCGGSQFAHKPEKPVVSQAHHFHFRDHQSIELSEEECAQHRTVLNSNVKNCGNQS